MDYPLFQTGAEVAAILDKAAAAPTHEDVAAAAASVPRYAYNLLDNSNFTNPVNQRGQTSYSGAVYGIDRWKGITSALTVTLDTNGVTISGHWMYQVLDTNILKSGGNYTLAACESDGTISVVSFTQGTTASVANKIVYENVSGNDRVRLHVGTWVWAALYEGEYTAATLPKYMPKGYAAELLECQRYYYNGGQYTFFSGYISTNAYVWMTLPTQMRETPTLTCNSVNVRGSITGEGNAQTSSFSTVKMFGNMLRINVYDHGKSNNQPIVALSDYFELSADL